MPERRMVRVQTTPHPPHKTLLLLRSSLPRAKKHSFSAKSDTRALTTRCSVGLRRYKRGGTKFNTFARWVFLRLSRSCRVAEKSDPIDRFSGPDLQKITKNRWVLSNFLTTRAVVLHSDAGSVLFRFDIHYLGTQNGTLCSL